MTVFESDLQLQVSPFQLSNLSRFSEHLPMRNENDPISKYAPAPILADKSAQVDFTPKTSSIAVATNTSPSSATQEQRRDEHVGLSDHLKRQYETEMTRMRQEYDRNLAHLKEENARLERYGKRVKALYREATKNAAPMGEVVDEVLAKEQRRFEDIDGIVRQLEENNRVLDETLQNHEKRDKKLKEAAKKEAAKTKELKKQLRSTAAGNSE